MSHFLGGGNNFSKAGAVNPPGWEWMSSPSTMTATVGTLLNVECHRDAVLGVNVHFPEHNICVTVRLSQKSLELAARTAPFRPKVKNKLHCSDATTSFKFLSVISTVAIMFQHRPFPFPHGKPSRRRVH